MKYKLPLIVVDDMAVSRKFYEEVLNQKVIIDYGANITFSGDFALQTKESWVNFIRKSENDVLFKRNNETEAEYYRRVLTERYKMISEMLKDELMELIQ